MNIGSDFETLFAVCEKLNEQVMLTSDTLRHSTQYNLIHVRGAVIVKSAMSTVPDEVADEDEESSNQSDEVLTEILIL